MGGLCSHLQPAGAFDFGLFVGEGLGAHLQHIALLLVGFLRLRGRLHGHGAGPPHGLDEFDELLG